MRRKVHAHFIVLRVTSPIKGFVPRGLSAKLLSPVVAFAVIIVDLDRCYDCASWTTTFSFLSIPHFSSLATVLQVLLLRADCAPPPLSIACLTLAVAIPSTRTSVPTDVHPSCPSYAPLSSLLPYVLSHLWCVLPNPLTCVTPRPLYAS